MNTRIGTVFGAILLCLSAALGSAALLLTVADVFARYVLAQPLTIDALLNLLVTGSVMLGAAAALNILRDPAAPRGPRWLGWPGAAFVSLAVAATMAFVIFALGRAMQDSIRHGDVTVGFFQIPTWYGIALALFGCAVLAVFALAGAVLARRRFPVLPIALALLLAALSVGSITLEFPLLRTMVARSFVLFEGTVLAVLAAGAIAGAIAALKSRARVASLAAPALPIMLTGFVGQIPIGAMLTGGAAIFLLMAVGHALLGLARGFRAASDDLIGLGVLALSIPALAIGAATPSEIWAVLALPCVFVPVLVAAILRRENVAGALAQGWSHGIGALFIVMPIIVLVSVGAYLGVGTAISGMLAPVLESAAVAGPFAIAATTLLAAVLGAPAGIILALAFLVPSLKTTGVDPMSVGLAIALSGMAGGCLFGWLAPRLARAAPEDCTPVPAREAALGAVPPFVAALLIWFVPDLLLQFN